MVDRDRGAGDPGTDRVSRTGPEGAPPAPTDPAADGTADGIVPGSLADMLRTWMHEGRPVRLAVGDTIWLARPVGVSAELVQVGPTCVVLAHVTSVRAGLAGVHVADPPVPPPATLLELLEQLAARTENVEVGGPDLDHVAGRLLSVTPGSHIEVAADDGSEWLVPLSAVGWLSHGGPRGI